MSSTELQVTSFDPDDLKTRLIQFLQSKEEFDDFNFEGSALLTIIDLLVRNDTYTAYMANMLANESFLSSAQIRSNVVDHASKLSYVAGSCVAAKAVVNISVFPAAIVGIPNYINMVAGTQFLSSVNGVAYSFVTASDTLLRYNADTQAYEGFDIELYQGQLIESVVEYDIDVKRIVIPNDRVDMSTLNVVVADSNALSNPKTFKYASSIREISSDSLVYFTGETPDGEYYIEFGRNIIGVEPSDGSQITLTYINTEELHANGVGTMISASPIGGYYDSEIEVVSIASGGSEREDIDHIRFLATRNYEGQDRALNPYDFTTLIKTNFPFVRSVIAWGGEENDPPLYGDVLISILPNNLILLSQSIKTQIRDFLKDYCVGSITPVIVDPTIFGLDLTIDYTYDNRLTNKTPQQLESELVTTAQSYNTTELGDFQRFFNKSRMIDLLMNIRGIESVVVSKELYYSFDPLRFVNPIYTINFNNSIVPGSVSMTGFEVAISGSGYRLYDLNGLIYVQYTNNINAVVTNEVGVVDYETGLVEFSINMIQASDDPVKLYITPVEDNLYVVQNTVMTIQNIDTQLQQRRS